MTVRSKISMDWNFIKNINCLKKIGPLDFMSKKEEYLLSHFSPMLDKNQFEYPSWVVM